MPFSFPSLLLDLSTQTLTFIAHLVAPFLITGKHPRQKHFVTAKKKKKGGTFHHQPASSTQGDGAT